MTVRILHKVDTAPEMRSRLESILSDHAEKAGHPFDNRPCLLEAWDGDTFAGGLQAKIGSHWVFIELLAVAPTHRGTGLGRALIHEVERIARDKGKSGLWLDTYSFQAPDFYAHMGFTEVGRIEDYPPGQARIFLQKRF